MNKIKKFEDYNFVVIPTKGKEAKEFIKKLDNQFISTAKKTNVSKVI